MRIKRFVMLCTVLALIVGLLAGAATLPTQAADAPLCSEQYGVEVCSNTGIEALGVIFIHWTINWKVSEPGKGISHVTVPLVEECPYLSSFVTYPTTTNIGYDPTTQVYGAKWNDGSDAYFEPGKTTDLYISAPWYAGVELKSIYVKLGNTTYSFLALVFNCNDPAEWTPTATLTATATEPPVIEDTPTPIVEATSTPTATATDWKTSPTEPATFTPTPTPLVSGEESTATPSQTPKPTGLDLVDEQNGIKWIFVPWVKP